MPIANVKENSLFVIISIEQMVVSGWYVRGNSGLLVHTHLCLCTWYSVCMRCLHMWVCSVGCVCVYRGAVQWSGLGTLIMNCCCSG